MRSKVSAPGIEDLHKFNKPIAVSIAFAAK